MQKKQIKLTVTESKMVVGGVNSGGDAGGNPAQRAVMPPPVFVEPEEPVGPSNNP